jgi:type II secretory pathway component PulF
MNLQWLKGNPLPWKLRRQFFERATSQLDNELPLERVLARFRKALERRGKRRAAVAMADIESAVRNGDTLDVAMRSTLSNLERTVLDAGIRSGQLAQAMQLILDVREMVDRIVWRLFIGFLPSVVYSYALYKVLRFIGLDVVPEFEATLPAEKWHGWARVLYLMGQFASGVTMPLIACLLAAYVAWCIWALPNWIGRGRTFFDRWVFPFPLYREITGFAWLLSFLALQRAGTPEVDVLARQARTASAWLASRLTAIRSEIRNGKELSVAMERTGNGFPSEDLIDDIGEYAGFENSGDKLSKAAYTHSRAIERKVLYIGGGVALFMSITVYAAMFVMQLASNSLSSTLTATMRHM